jgi:hypothetical protein
MEKFAKLIEKIAQERMARENKKLEQLETTSVQMAIQSEQAAVVVGKSPGAVTANATGKNVAGKGDVVGASDGGNAAVTNTAAAGDEKVKCLQQLRLSEAEEAEARRTKS